MLEDEEGVGEEGEGEGEEGGGEEGLKVEEVENARTESSGEDESLEKALEPSQLAVELQAAPATLLVSSPEPPPALPPAVDAPVTQVAICEFFPMGHADMPSCWMA